MIEQKNIDSPFTEIFALLKRQALVVHGNYESNHHESDIIIAMQSHIDNAIEVLLDGLQDIGMLMGLARHVDRKTAESLSRLGFFISSISNMTEALNGLKLDLDYVTNAYEDSNLLNK